MRVLTCSVRFVAALAVLVAAAVPAASAAPADLESKRREAASLEAAIASAGERLSAATEDYNEAVLARAALEARSARLDRDLADAASHLEDVRGRLGRRARFMYKHPAGWAASWIEPDSLGSFARAQQLASSVIESDADLLLETRRARAELERVSAEVAVAERDAAGRERAMQVARRAAETALREERSLLRSVNTEIAQMIEAERRRELEEAAARARREAARRAQQEAARAAAPGGRAVGTTASVPAKTEAGVPKAGASKAVSTAVAQLGKPYEWGAAGPETFDCSGLTQYAWNAAGVTLPHSSRAQFSSLPKVAMDDVRPGDLLFYGDPIHHVGIYEGNGVMVNAPQTGETVRRSSIYRKDFAGAARP